MKVLDKTLRDCLGNTCRIEVYQNGPLMCEVWMRDFNCSVPRRYYGTAQDCQLHADLWLHHKEKAGFSEKDWNKPPPPPQNHKEVA